MSNQQFYIALAIPSFLIIADWVVKFQSCKRMANRMGELHRDLKANPNASHDSL